MFGQTFETHDFAIIGLLIVLEGVLSIDNALVLGLLARRLPKHQQSRALTYGLVGAFVFRVLAIATASFLLEWRFAKLLGGAYLVYISAKHFFFEEKHHDESVTSAQAIAPATGIPAPDAIGTAAAPGSSSARTPASPTSVARYARFWPTVAVIELTDIAFAIDSILAAIAMVSTVPKPDGQRFHPKLWVVVAGGMLGVILMRFAAVVFIRLLEKFPRFETSAYLLVIVIGSKLIVDWAFNGDPHHPRLDFHHPTTPAFWIFWIGMLACFAIGFIPHRQQGDGEATNQPA